jgi:hypothetical protein
MNYAPFYREDAFIHVRLRKDVEPNSYPRISAVAREFIKVNGTPRVNGTKVEGKKMPAGSGQLGDQMQQADANFVGTHHNIAQTEISTAGLTKLIGAMAAAILRVEKQRRVDSGTTSTTTTTAATKRAAVPLDTMRRGKLVENDLIYRQTFVIRSYEAGFDKIASIETIANLFQVI